jgi:hypothetical protein
MEEKSQSYANASSDVKRSIIQRAEPAAVRRLCQTDRRSREFCRERLPAAEKFRLCLDDGKSAEECDLVPMFSKQQFLSLVPAQIEIFAEDAVQVTHQFYSQKYKLPTDGFAVALLKAKLMNTICAVIRPEFLVSTAAQELEIPKYLDMGLLDAVVQAYSKNMAIDTGDKFFSVRVTLQDILQDKIIIDAMYDYDDETKTMISIESYVDIRRLIVSQRFAFNQAVNDDPFLQSHYPVLTERHLFELMNNGLNVFRLSRFLKIAFDMGYFYQPKIIVTARGGPIITQPI